MNPEQLETALNKQPLPVKIQNPAVFGTVCWEACVRSGFFGTISLVTFVILFGLCHSLYRADLVAQKGQRIREAAGKSNM